MKIKNIWLHWYGTAIHKFWVSWYIGWFCFRMLWRSFIHDYTKYGMTESRGFFKVIDGLKTSTYGSKEYHAMIDEIKPSIEAHYKRWSHHPEHYENKINGMNLEDLVEMWCDWKAAVRRHTDGELNKSIEHNKTRHNISEQVCSVLKNSI